ncbi:MAG: phosphate ABC transporter substrate-binding protein PstS [Candidatus Methylacidiphilales bacterium]
MNTHIRTCMAAIVALGSAASLSSAAEVKVDPKLPEYKQVSGVSGNLNSVGSDTLNNLMTLWAEGFKAIYPNVKIQIEGKGTSTAPPALIAGTSQLGPMSREMKSKEIDDFEKKFGYKPTGIKVAIDALAVYVHKDNPIKQLTMQQVDGVFSSTRKLGGEAINTWGQLGLTGEWAGKAISLYGRNSASGTYGFFKDKALGGGDFRAEVKEQPGSSAVVQGITSDLAGIGYSGIGYRTSGVRPVPLIGKDGKPYDTTRENAASGKYPLSRFLYIYINKAPNKPADTLTAEFMKFILSKQGQEVVVKDGYFPIPASLSAAEVKKLN